MKVTCLNNTLSDAQKRQVGFADNISPRYKLTIGKTYTVLGLSFQNNVSYNKGTIALLRNDIAGCSFVPFCLLSISDPRVSSHWIGEVTGDNNFLLWPKEFFADYFHDELSEGIGAVVGVFDSVCKLLDDEADSNLKRA